MSEKMRDISVVLLVLLVAVAGFAAGFLTHNFVSGKEAAGSNADRFALLDEAWSYVEASYLGDRPADRRLAYGAIRGALAELGDPYTVFVEPAARQEERDSCAATLAALAPTSLATRPGRRCWTRFRATRRKLPASCPATCCWPSMGRSSTGDDRDRHRRPGARRRAPA